MNNHQLRVPYKSGTQIEEMAREANKKAFGDFQNSVIKDAFNSLFEKGGLKKLKIKDYSVADMGDKVQISYNSYEDCIEISSAAYDLLPSGREDVKFSLARAIGQAILDKERGTGVPGNPDCQECDPLWQIDQFAFYFVIPTPLLRKCLHDGMAPNKIVEYFGVSPETLDHRMKML